MIRLPRLARLLACAMLMAVLLPAAALPALSPAPDRGRRVDRGIVQSVTATEIILKVLDGSTVTIAVNEKTRVLVDGKRAALADIKPGFVAEVVHEHNRPAREVRAFEVAPAAAESRLRTDRGTVLAVLPGAIVLRVRGGEKVRIPVDASTRILLDRKRASLSEIRPGFAVVVVHDGTSPAREVRAVSRRKR